MPLRYFGPGANDLSPTAVSLWNALINEAPLRIDGVHPGDYGFRDFSILPKYFATAADADANQNDVLDTGEAQGYLHIFAARAHRLTGTAVQQPILPGMHPDGTPPSSFQANDIMVTVESAQYPGFEVIPPTYRNHSTILWSSLPSHPEQDVAYYLLSRYAQIQEDATIHLWP